MTGKLKKAKTVSRKASTALVHSPAAHDPEAVIPLDDDQFSKF
jgi:hypothetical protein